MSYIKRSSMGAVVEDDIASYMQKMPPIAGRGRTGLSSFVSTNGGYVRTGYVRTGLGAIAAADATKVAARLYDISNTWSMVVKEAQAVAPEDRAAVYAALRVAMKGSHYSDKSSGAFVDRLAQQVPPGSAATTAPTYMAMARPMRASTGAPPSTPPKRAAIQVGLTQAQKDAMSPEDKAAYDVKQAAAAKAFDAARANAVRVVDHSGGQTKYVRDNTPEGLKAQAEGRLQTVEQGGSGVLTPPTPEQAASPTPVTPDGTQALATVGGGLFSGPLPWIIGGGALLALVLLTRKKGGAGAVPAKKTH